MRLDLYPQLEETTDEEKRTIKVMRELGIDNVRGPQYKEMTLSDE